MQNRVPGTVFGLLCHGMCGMNTGISQARVPCSTCVMRAQVLLCQQQTIAQLLELLHRAKHAANQALQPPGPVIAALRSIDEAQQRQAREDRWVPLLRSW